VICFELLQIDNEEEMETNDLKKMVQFESESKRLMEIENEQYVRKHFFNNLKINFKINLFDGGLSTDISKDFLNWPMPEKIQKAISQFSNLQSKLQNPKELPNFYSVNACVISPNLLQPDKYLDNKFTYYLTEYRKQILGQIKQVPQEKLKIILTGIQDSGKSYFLSDYVLRQRSLCKDSDCRILYINNSEEYCKMPLDYIISELVYELCFECEDENELSDFEYPPRKDKTITSKNQIVHWISYLRDHLTLVDLSSLRRFMKRMKKFLNAKGKKVILIWDQIHILYKKKASALDEKIFNIFCSRAIFDLIFVTSNGYDPIFKISLEDFQLYVNPFQMFNEIELKKLIRLDCDNYHPKDIMDLEIYTDMVLELIEGSISEYHLYKKIWNWSGFQCKILEKTFHEIKNDYITTRKEFIVNCEIKFMKEKIINFKNLMGYLECLRKFKAYRNYKAIKNLDERVIIYFNFFFNFLKLF